VRGRTFTVTSPCQTTGACVTCEAACRARRRRIALSVSVLMAEDASPHVIASRTPALPAPWAEAGQAARPPGRLAVAVVAHRDRRSREIFCCNISG